jgi:hypothetical protein
LQILKMMNLIAEECTQQIGASHRQDLLLEVCNFSYLPAAPINLSLFSASFSSPQPFSTNPFAAKPSMGRPSMDEGSSSWQGLTPSKLGAFGAPPMSSPKIVLKPSAFSSASAGSSPAVVAPKTSFPLNPSRLGSPFAKGQNLQPFSMFYLNVNIFLYVSSK